MEPLSSSSAAITDTFDQHEELDAARAFFDVHGGSIPLSAFGRALQDPVLLAWKGQAANVRSAQDALLERARLNGAARDGRYDASMETAR